MYTLRNWMLLPLLFAAMACTQTPRPQPGENYPSVTNDGTWCWFSDPRAIYHGNSVVTGWVTKDGSIEAAALNPENGKIASIPLMEKLEVDDHDNPAFVAVNGEVQAFYTKHIPVGIYQDMLDFSNGFAAVTLHKETNPIDSAELEKFPRYTTTYANPYALKAENNRLYVFGRWTGFKPNVMWSDNGGHSFTKARVFITNFPFDQGNRPYVKYYSDGNSRIHIVFTDGHPRVEPLNSVYYAYYEQGAFYRVDGSVICSLQDAPFEPKDASLLYQASEEEGRAWVYDICADASGNPVVLYARYPNEETHIYHYATYNGSQWTDVEICNAGKWFPQTPESEREREPHYSGGLTVNPSNTKQVFVSREVDGTFEIERFTLDAEQKTWSITPITQQSVNDNVRPYFPRGGNAENTPVLLWMNNKKYVHYTNYATEIKYAVLPR